MQGNPDGFLGAQAISRKRTLEGSNAFRLPMAGGIPYVDQGISNVYTKLRFAPLPKNAHYHGNQGQPIFLYRPDKNLTGTDNTMTIIGLPYLNYGLHQRAVYQKFHEEGRSDRDISDDIITFKEWPLTVSEFLGERQIVPYGVHGDMPPDPRQDGAIISRSAHLYGIADYVPWMWGPVQRGDRVGFRVSEVPSSRVLPCDINENKINSLDGESFLQVLPMVSKTGREPYHSVRLEIDLDNRLNFHRSHVRFVAKEIEPDIFGLPLGNFLSGTEERDEVNNVVDEGFFMMLGTVKSMTGQPAQPNQIMRITRSQNALNALSMTHNSVDLILEPNQRLNPVL